MNNQDLIPSIDTFLDKIDPDKTIERNQAMMQIGAVVLGKSTEKIKLILNEEQNKEIDNILAIEGKEMPTKVFEYLKEIGKLDDFNKTIGETTNEVRNDYIKTQLTALPEEKRTPLFVEFPALKTLFER